MNKEEIEKIQKISYEIENFKSCYKGNELWGRIDDFVDPETLIAFLIEHPYFQEIADNIKKLSK
jgi:hypothetical protein